MPAGNTYPSRHLVPYPPFQTCLWSICWDQIPRTCHVFTRFFTLKTDLYFLDFDSSTRTCKMVHFYHYSDEQSPLKNFINEDNKFSKLFANFLKNVNFGKSKMNNCRVKSEIGVFVATYLYKIFVLCHTFIFTFGKVTDSQNLQKRNNENGSFFSEFIRLVIGTMFDWIPIGLWVIHFYFRLALHFPY